MKGELKMNNTRRKQIQGIIDKLEDLKSEIENLKDEEVDAEGHSQRVKEVASLYELKLSEDRLDEEASSKASQRGVESEKLELEKEKIKLERDKMDHELKIKKEETKQGWVRFGADLGKVILTIAGNAGMLAAIMKFEETGTISNKFLNFTFKPRL